MANIKIFNPPGLAKPAGTYSQIAHAKTQEVVFIAGQVPTDASGALVGKGDFEAQCAQTFANIHTAFRAVGADWNNVVQFTSFLVRAEDAAGVSGIPRPGISKIVPRRAAAEYATHYQPSGRSGLSARSADDRLSLSGGQLPRRHIFQQDT